jgi:hypothetical protein
MAVAPVLPEVVRSEDPVSPRGPPVHHHAVISRGVVLESLGLIVHIDVRSLGFCPSDFGV